MIINGIEFDINDFELKDLSETQILDIEEIGEMSDGERYELLSNYDDRIIKFLHRIVQYTKGVADIIEEDVVLAMKIRANNSYDIAISLLLYSVMHHDCTGDIINYEVFNDLFNNVTITPIGADDFIKFVYANKLPRANLINNDKRKFKEKYNTMAS